MKVVSLFSGIGGIEFGLQQAGHESVAFCEIDPFAQAVLAKQFPGRPIFPDVSELKSLPVCDLVSAGFPCQDLSLAGQKAGIEGAQSSLVEHLFRLIKGYRRTRPEWILVENVPFMLILNSSNAMRFLVKELEDLGYRWAYRVVDARAFGLPQRRQRVFLLASRRCDPRDVLLADNEGTPDALARPSDIDRKSYYGFYWTEGRLGAGWVREAVPPIKGGSGLGIPSAPAIWIPAQDFVGTPDQRDAERLQGFPADWTLPAESAKGARRTIRWRLIGNAVCTAMSGWVGQRLAAPGQYDARSDRPIESRRWPKAAWGEKGQAYEANVSEWPIPSKRHMLKDFLEYPLKPLSERAANGFLGRAKISTEIAYSPKFFASLEAYIKKVSAGGL